MGRFFRGRVPAMVAALAIGVAGLTLSAKTTFSSVWKSPDAAGVSFAGQKVAAVVIDRDESLRVAGEEALAEELTKRGMQGVPSYRIVPKELFQKTEEARGWFERSGVQGVVALRLISDEQKKTIQPSTWSTAYYTSLWGYYGYGWGAVYSPGSSRTDRWVSLETLIFSVPRNSLLWAGVSTSDNPKTARAVVEEVVKEAVNEMEKQGLAGRPRK
jgi:hypothetical protein